MSANRVQCGNCGTENEANRDVCVKCGQPLTASAEMGLRTQLDAQDHGGLLGAEKDFSPAVGPEMTVAPGMVAGPVEALAVDPGSGAPSDQPEGRPQRRS